MRNFIPNACSTGDTNANNAGGEGEKKNETKGRTQNGNGIQETGERKSTTTAGRHTPHLKKWEPRMADYASHVVGVPPNLGYRSLPIDLVPPIVAEASPTLETLSCVLRYTTKPND